FLDLDDLLLLLGIVGLLLLLILELAVVHQAADRWIRRGSHFHQIHIGLSGKAEGFLDADDANGLVVHAVQADFGSHDFTIQPMLALVIARTAVKEVSDVEFLQARGPFAPHQLSLNTRPARPTKPHPPQRRRDRHAFASGLAGDVWSD